MSTFLRTLMLASLIAVTGASGALALGAHPREVIMKPYAEKATGVQHGRAATTSGAPAKHEQHRMRSDKCDNETFRLSHHNECYRR
jgi:hypothetical protein